MTNRAGLAPGTGRDPFDASLVLGLPEDSLLGVFNRAGVLAPVDVHVALRLARLGPDPDDSVALAVALAVRGPRVGHVHVDLTTVRSTAAADVEEDVDLDALPWPAPSLWLTRLEASPVVAVGEKGPTDRPLRLVGSALYLDRHWRDEQAVAAAMMAAAGAVAPAVDEALLARGLSRLFPPDAAAEQLWAAASAVLRRLTVVAGGPGTGKTTTVARILALLEEQAGSARLRPPLVALTAPTGKAAARMEEAVHAEAGLMAVSEEIRGRLLAVGASTLHRLLGRHPANASRFRHDRHNRLPHDVVIVDETSMVSSWLMARLAEAIRPDARLVLVGDPEQLASVEAGAVLGDIVGPALARMRMRTPAAAALGRATGVALPVVELASSGPAIGDGIVVLRKSHRFGGALAELAAGIREGDVDGTLRALSSGSGAVEWLELDPAGAGAAQLQPLREAVVGPGLALRATARAGEAGGSLLALARFRVLCAHRRGPAGVVMWNGRIEGWLAEEDADAGPGGSWYAGRPVMVTANDYSLRLFNGDVGVAVSRAGGGIGVAFDRGGTAVTVNPSRLSDLETVYAMTVHKAQGSEFSQVAVLLPEPTSRILTRELLYTAVTRAQRRVMVVGTEESVRAAVGRPIARASGLTERLWRFHR